MIKYDWNSNYFRKSKGGQNQLFVFFKDNRRDTASFAPSVRHAWVTVRAFKPQGPFKFNKDQGFFHQLPKKYPPIHVCTVCLVCSGFSAKRFWSMSCAGTCEITFKYGLQLDFTLVQVHRVVVVLIENRKFKKSNWKIFET